MAIDPSFFQKAASAGESPDMSKGASGYFSDPDTGLDPHLFEGDHLRSNVRVIIYTYLRKFLGDRLRLKGVGSWLHVWIAGSGISYQWAANRGNGDLDVLFGVDFEKFRAANAELAEMNEVTVADQVNDLLRTELWPRTQTQLLNGQTYEVTYYWSPGTGDDITAIRPYAAYNLTDDTWTVRPPALQAGDQHRQFSLEWYKIADRDAALTRMLSTEYQGHLNALSTEPAGTPRWHASGSSLNQLVQEAGSLLSEIHTGRREAFQGSGQGYGDYHNFRWQRAKETGTIQALHAIAKVGEEANQEQQAAQFGAPIADAGQAMRDAIAVHRPGLK